MTWLPAGFTFNVLVRIRNTGPRPWSENYEHPVTGITPSERDAMRALLKLELLETAYVGTGLKERLVIRAPIEGPKPQPQEKTNAAGYAETPALLALRARRRALGR